MHGVPYDAGHGGIGDISSGIKVHGVPRECENGEPAHSKAGGIFQEKGSGAVGADIPIAGIRMVFA